MLFYVSRNPLAMNSRVFPIISYILEIDYGFLFDF